MRRLVLVIAAVSAVIVVTSPARATPGAPACMREALRVCGGPVPSRLAYRRAHVARLARHPFRYAYHIPRFDQAEAEAEVHTQYRYRTPYLPYWVFP